MALGRSQIHLLQRAGDGLIGTPMQNPGQVTVMHIQFTHLLEICSVLKFSLLPNILAQRFGLSREKLKIHNLHRMHIFRAAEYHGMSGGSLEKNFGGKYYVR